MICENEFCLYNEDNKCILKNVVINNQGCCDNLIYLHLTDDINIEKSKQLKQHIKNLKNNKYLHFRYKNIKSLYTKHSQE